MRYPFRICILLTVIFALKCENTLSAGQQPKVDTPSGNRIAKLAKLHFQKEKEPILPAERKLFEAAEIGEVPHFRESDSIRADRLVWLCTDKQALASMSHRGVRFSGGNVQGDFDLDWVTITFPLAFVNCGFSGDISLRFANLMDLNLSGAKIQALRADSLHVKANVSLRFGFQALGEVRLVNAKIEGCLDCENGKFLNEQGTALSCNDAEISGATFLRSGFHSEGLVDMMGAKIGSDLDCAEGSFFSRQGPAISCFDARIAGNLELWKAKVGGQVDFSGATIDGEVNCAEGQFAAHQGPVLSSSTAKIGGRFICVDALIFTSTGDAIRSDSARFGSDVVMHGLCTNGTVRLRNATVNGTLDIVGGKVSSSDDFALEANSVTIALSALFRDGFVADGGIDLGHGKILGDIDCANGQLYRNAKRGFALAANSVYVGHNLLLDKEFYADGEVLLKGATIDGDLICTEGKFSNDGANTETPNALDATGVKIAGSASFDKRFGAKGRLLFANSNIGRDLVVKDVSEPEKMDLDLRFTKVGTLLCAKNSWPKKGGLHLHGFIYDEIDTDARPGDAELLEQWIACGESEVQQSEENENGPSSGWISASVLNAHPVSNLQSNVHKVSHEFLSQPYEQLAKILREMGLETAAVKVMITKNAREGDDDIFQDLAAIEHDRLSVSGGWVKGQYANLAKDCGRFAWDFCWYKGLGKLIDYGYHPWHALIVSFMIIVLGRFIFIHAYRTGFIVPDSDSAWERITGWTHASPRRLKDDYPKFNAFVYSLETFVPLVKLGIGDKWVIPGGAVRWYLWIHILLGWVFTTLWVGGFTGLIKS